MNQAIRRLQQDFKQLQENPLVGCNAAPLDSDIKTWYANVVGPEGTPYYGICIRFVMEFPDSYPIDPPKAFFVSDITYVSGASYKDSSGRTVVCLDLFGNFRDVHIEWKSDGVASGWTPSYTVTSILVSMQSLIMSGLLSIQPDVIARTKKSSSEIKCAATGHDGSDPLKFVPRVPTFEEVRKIEEERRAKEAANKKEGFDVSNHFICYATQQVFPNVQLGYGIQVSGNQVSTPCEYLSLEAFKNGIRNGTRNQRISYWIPLYITKDHFTATKDHLFNNSQVIYTELRKASKNLRQNAPLALQVLEILSASMNNMVVEVMNNQNNLTANDVFIDGYFAFYRILVEAAQSNPKLVEHVDGAITKFLQGPAGRNKSEIPNLGNFLIGLLISKKYNWPSISREFISECDARNVFWYVKGNPKNPAKYPELINEKSKPRKIKVFQATQTSRNLVCFQVKFLQMAKSISIEDLDKNYGIPEPEARDVLKQAYKKIVAIDNWEGYFQWINVAPTKDREEELVDALLLSKQNKYH